MSVSDGICGGWPDLQRRYCGRDLVGAKRIWVAYVWRFADAGIMTMAS
ncbi:MAG TPA: hypothetical protein VMT67_15430 [Terriglobales bacterium]|nr:hypothetical protein [Terriglobales bacterium]